MTALLLCAALWADLRIILPNGTELSAQRVDVMPDARLLVVYEAPLFADGFE